ncbi:unnamed protein product [Caenorhabditis brenneri]
MKWPLLINHFWASWLDLIFCSLVTPYVYLRFFGFIGFGLFTLLGIPILPQVILGVISCFLIQTMVPLGIFMVPIVGVLLDQLTNSFTQDMMNLAIITIGLHGILESISIVMVHRSYRRAVWELVTRRKTESEGNLKKMK